MIITIIFQILDAFDLLKSQFNVFFFKAENYILGENLSLPFSIIFNLFKMGERERERVCVCVWEREREVDQVGENKEKEY